MIATKQLKIVLIGSKFVVSLLQHVPLVAHIGSIHSIATTAGHETRDKPLDNDE